MLMRFPKRSGPLKQCLTLIRVFSGGVFAIVMLARSILVSVSADDIVVTNDLILEKGAILKARLVVRASHVTIEGNGATLQGPGTVGETNTLEQAGVGVLLEGSVNVTIRNLNARGFATGLLARDGRALLIEGCDFSDNYHNPKHGWGELPPRGGLRLERVQKSVVRATKANQVWNGLYLVESDD